MEEKKPGYTRGVGIKEASEMAKRKLAEALNKQADNTVSISREGDNWSAVVEIVDEEYLPGKSLKSMNDIIGVYEVKLSDNGDLLSWNKKSVHKRGRTD